MPGTCSICGERCVQREKSDGSYKGACVECKVNFDRPPRHINQCDSDDCVVCESWREENG